MILTGPKSHLPEGIYFILLDLLEIGAPLLGLAQNLVGLIYILYFFQAFRLIRMKIRMPFFYTSFISFLDFLKRGSFFNTQNRIIIFQLNGPPEKIQDSV